MTATPQISIILVNRGDSTSAERTQQEVFVFFKKWQIPVECFISKPQKLADHLDKSLGSTFFVLPAELHSPLSEIFKILQAFTSQPDLQIVFGNRYGKKDNPFLKSSSLRCELDRLYHPLYSSSLKDFFADPLCDSLGIKKECWDKLPIPEKKQINHFKWTPFFMRISLTNHLRTCDVPLFDDGHTSPHFPKLKARWSYFWTSSKFS